MDKGVARVLTFTIALCLTPLLSKAQTCTPTPELFGYAAIPLSGAKPLLVVLVDFDDLTVSDLSPTQPRNEAYYDDVIFGIRAPGSRPFSNTTLNGLYQASSGGRLSLARAGLVRVHYPRRFADLTLPHYDEEVTRRTAQVFPLQNYDRNGDHTIDQTEIAIVRIANTPPNRGGGQPRDHTVTFPVREGSRTVTYTFDGEAINVDQELDISLIAHELLHFFGFHQDIYGPGRVLNFKATFMGASGTGGPVLLDAFHRMKAGWTVPRFADISAPKSAYSSNYSGGPEEKTPIILYDQTRCANEFFMMEFRNPRHSSSPYDSAALGPGVLLWYVRKNPDHSLVEFNWPPPILPLRPPSNAVGLLLEGPGGPRANPILTRTTPEFAPTWFNAPASTANIGIEVDYSPTGGVAGIQWRPLNQAFVARIQRVQSATPAPVMDAAGTYSFALEGIFPVRRDGIVVRLVSLAREYPLILESLTPTRIVVRKDRAIEPGTYLVMIERPAPRPVRSVFNAGPGIRFR